MGTKTNTLVITGVAAAALGAVAAFALCDLLAPKHGIILRATNTDIDSQKWLAIEGVLKRPSVTQHADSREKLYRVREFNGGVPVGAADEGTLDKTELLEDYDATVAELQRPPGFTGHAFQIGVGAMERSKRIPKDGMETPLAHARPNLVESEEMVKAVDGVL